MTDPPPNLQALVAAYGGYDKITVEAWADYDREMFAWHQRLREGETPVVEVDPNKLCICGLPGVHHRIIKGRKIWRCEGHRKFFGMV